MRMPPWGGRGVVKFCAFSIPFSFSVPFSVVGTVAMSSSSVGEEDDGGGDVVVSLD